MKVTKLLFPRKWDSNNIAFRFPIKAFGNVISKNIIKILFLSLLIIFLSSCSTSKEFSEYENVEGKFIESGIACWYGPNFHGKKTANGEIYDMFELTAAHRTLPFNSILRVINSENGKSVIVRINDRGPYAKNRIIDLSKAAAEKITIIKNGTALVKLHLLNNINLPRDLEKPHFTVQVGSFRNRKDAENYASKISNSRVVKADINGNIYYRVYVGLFTEKEKAAKLKSLLKDKGVDSFVKQVEN